MEENHKIEANYLEDLLEQQKRLLLQKDSLLAHWNDLVKLKQEISTKLSNTQDHVNPDLLST